MTDIDRLSTEPIGVQVSDHAGRVRKNWGSALLFVGLALQAITQIGPSITTIFPSIKWMPGVIAVAGAATLWLHNISSQIALVNYTPVQPISDVTDKSTNSQ